LHLVAEGGELGLLRLERGLFGRELRFESGVVRGLDEQWRLGRDGPQELLLCCVFEVGKAQFRK
jgi:hypothetical protein